MATIPIVVEEDDKTVGTLSGSSQKKHAVKNIDVEVLQKSLEDITSKLDSILEKAESPENFKLKEVEVSLGIDASGNFKLIGVVDAGVSVKGAISLKFSR